MKHFSLMFCASLAVGLVGCIPTPIPRPYEFGALVPEVLGTVVDAESGAPIRDAKITVQYARCDDLRYSSQDWPNYEAGVSALKFYDGQKTVMRNRSHPPSEWLAVDHSVSRSKSDTTDASGKFEFGSRDHFTFFVIPLVPNAPVGDFYDRYLAVYRVVIEHPDYGVQAVQPMNEIKLKKRTVQ